ncbi:hypothetical protein RvY_06835-2 [Ramazzottius varieornatus]|uniref:Out at first protein n=2 Tax=Ramazzottius varieornatus TaxID=947166 RepID=A0A1D1UZY4_RAMVA|nr:hypothetical protein RvY_06835-2 [Ramazzottius varieornatus]
MTITDFIIFGNLDRFLLSELILSVFLVKMSVFLVPISLASFFWLVTAVGQAERILVINAADGGGEALQQETFKIDTVQNVTTLSLIQHDGTIIHHATDFLASKQTFHLKILPIDDLGQTEAQELCFVLPLEENQHVSAEVLGTIRQINPSAIRHAEENRPLETFSMDSLASTEELSRAAPHIQKICGGSQTFASFPASNISPPGFSVQPVLLPQCNETASSPKPCLCSLPVCIVWYPCGLRYCTNDAQTTDGGQPVPFKCGIKACRKCRVFVYRVESNLLCLWSFL